jgi:hypothetical protein
MAKSRKRSVPDNPAIANEPTQQSQTAVATPEEPVQSGPPAESSASTAEDYRERVARRAYELYLSRGGSHGSDWEDWLAAERELIPNRGRDDADER